MQSWHAFHQLYWVWYQTICQRICRNGCELSLCPPEQQMTRRVFRGESLNEIRCLTKSFIHWAVGGEDSDKMQGIHQRLVLYERNLCNVDLTSHPNWSNSTQYWAISGPILLLIGEWRWATNVFMADIGISEHFNPRLNNNWMPRLILTISISALQKCIFLSVWLDIKFHNTINQ